jgi:hypothetical protein
MTGRHDGLGNVEDIVLSHGGNLVRMREALRCFKEQFGLWPTTLALGGESLASIRDNHLTQLGYARLAERMRIVSQIKHNQIVATDDDGNQFHYGHDPIWEAQRRVTTDEVDQWVWGISLD